VEKIEKERRGLKRIIGKGKKGESFRKSIEKTLPICWEKEGQKEVGGLTRKLRRRSTMNIKQRNRKKSRLFNWEKKDFDTKSLHMSHVKGIYALRKRKSRKRRRHVQLRGGGREGGHSFYRYLKRENTRTELIKWSEERNQSKRTVKRSATVREYYDKGEKGGNSQRSEGKEGKSSPS